MSERYLWAHSVMHITISLASIVTIVLRWSPIEFGQLGSSARLRGGSWWRWIAKRVAGGDESRWGLAAAELAGVEGDGHYSSIHYAGSSTGEV